MRQNLLTRLVDWCLSRLGETTTSCPVWRDPTGVDCEHTQKWNRWKKEKKKKIPWVLGDFDNIFFSFAFTEASCFLCYLLGAFDAGDFLNNKLAIDFVLTQSYFCSACFFFSKVKVCVQTKGKVGFSTFLRKKNKFSI